MEQSERIRELDRFKAGEINILVASDVAARGLDIKGVSHVFNYDVPWHPDDYVHRIGRTGRAGATGKAFTLVTPDDAEAVENIEKLTGFKIPRIKRADAPAAEPASEEPRPSRARRGDRRGPARAAAPVEAAAPAEAAPMPAERPAEPRRDERRRDRPPEPRRDDRRPARDAEPADDGWNGPVPAFLSQGFGTISED
jgi:superfamily II DNA/RNA helicase